jgi:hypothetical protein
VATTIGLALPFVLADLLRFVGNPVPYSLAGYVAIGGVLAGVLQWRLLRPRAGLRTMWWPALTPIGWILAASTVWVAEWLPRNVPGVLGAGRYLAVVLSGGLGAGTGERVGLAAREAAANGEPVALRYAPPAGAGDSHPRKRR